MKTTKIFKAQHLPGDDVNNSHRLFHLLSMVIGILIFNIFIVSDLAIFDTVSVNN